MADNRLQKLIELADGATPGEWRPGAVGKVIHVAETYDAVAIANRESDVRYIAAISPDVAKQLAADLLTLIETEPIVEIEDYEGKWECGFCNRRNTHDSDCPWATARRRWME